MSRIAGVNWWKALWRRLRPLSEDAQRQERLQAMIAERIARKLDRDLERLVGVVDGLPRALTMVNLQESLKRLDAKSRIQDCTFGEAPGSSRISLWK